MQAGNEQEPLWLVLIRRFGLMVGLFVAGAVTAFVYSYVPLHNAKNWEIGYLTERLAAKEEQLIQMETRLSAAKSDVSGRPDGETFRLLQDELDTADKTIKDLERRLSKSQKRETELEKSRKHWKQKFEEAEQARLADARKAAAAPPASPDVSALAPVEPEDGVLGDGDIDLQPDLVH